MSARLRVRWLGRLPYEEAWDLQRALHEGRVSGRTEDDYLLLEHPHTYTVGRFGDRSNVLITPELAAAVGAEIHQVDRGGDVTYHGPGQLVGYPIRHLGDRPAVAEHVHRLEAVLIAVLADLGITGRRLPAYPGVWTERGKVAAIGVRAAHRVTTHGFALNVAPDLGYFGHIVPCGIADRPVTSVAESADRPVSIEEVVDLLVPRSSPSSGTPRSTSSGPPLPGAPGAFRRPSRSTSWSPPSIFARSRSTLPIATEQLPASRRAR